MSIRNATERDIPQIIELFESFMSEIARTYPDNDYRPYIDQAIQHELKNLTQYYLAPQRNAFFICYAGNRIHGTIGFEEVTLQTAEMRRLIVSSGSRRKGLGKRLVQMVETECARIGYKELVLETSELQSAAITLYRQLGYQRDSENLASTLDHKGVSGIARYRFRKSISE